MRGRMRFFWQRASWFLSPCSQAGLGPPRRPWIATIPAQLWTSDAALREQWKVLYLPGRMIDPDVPGIYTAHSVGGSRSLRHRSCEQDISPAQCSISASLRQGIPRSADFDTECCARCMLSVWECWECEDDEVALSQCVCTAMLRVGFHINSPRAQRHSH